MKFPILRHEASSIKVALLPPTEKLRMERKVIDYKSVSPFTVFPPIMAGIFIISMEGARPLFEAGLY